MIVDPRGMDVMTWTSQVTPLLDRFGPVGVLQRPEEWQLWATHVMIQIGLQKLTDLPNPYTYVDWRNWADRFNQITDTLV